MTTARAGDWMDANPHLSDMDFTPFQLRVSTERYHARDYLAREREHLWMRVWQIAGRADEIPESGDWMEYRLFDQSWILVRGRDAKIRGFVNACRHRGNQLCHGRGNAARFTCRYHNWTFGLDGQLLAVAKPDFDAPLEEFAGAKQDLGLLEVPVECFGGFIFLNPDRNAAPLAQFLGGAADALAPYHLEDMVPVGLNVRERLECNWKVVMDAFGEGYHTQGVHPQLVAVVDLARERFHHYGDHGVSTAPFGAPALAACDAAQQVEAYMNLPTDSFPGFIDVLPRFAARAAAFRGPGGVLNFPPGTNARFLLQQAMRDTLTAKGLDVSGLTDSQMIDYQFWLFFPNVFIQVAAGETTIIMVEPDPEGDPNRCFWSVMFMQFLPPEQRAAQYTPLRDIPEGEHFPYFLALEQDFEQMPVQQTGLRNSTLGHLVLTKQEPRVAHFHAALDRWIE